MQNAWVEQCVLHLVRNEITSINSKYIPLSVIVCAGVDNISGAELSKAIEVGAKSSMG